MIKLNKALLEKSAWRLTSIRYIRYIRYQRMSRGGAGILICVLIIFFYIFHGTAISFNFFRGVTIFSLAFTRAQLFFSLFVTCIYRR